LSAGSGPGVAGAFRLFQTIWPGLSNEMAQVAEMLPLRCFYFDNDAPAVYTERIYLEGVLHNYTKQAVHNSR